MQNNQAGYIHKDNLDRNGMAGAITFGLEE